MGLKVESERGRAPGAPLTVVQPSFPVFAPMGKTAERSLVPVDNVGEVDLDSGLADDLDEEDDLVADLVFATAASLFTGLGVALDLLDEDLLGQERRRR